MSARLSALVLALTFGFTPIIRVACEIGCFSPLTPTGCHESAQKAGAPLLQSGSLPCDHADGSDPVIVAGSTRTHNPVSARIVTVTPPVLLSVMLSEGSSLHSPPGWTSLSTGITSPILRI